MLPDLHVDLHRRRGLAVNGFDTIARWLRAADPINARDIVEREPRVSFADLWQRIARPAVDELRRDHPGHCASVWDDLADDLVAKLADNGEPVLWQQFNARRTPADVVGALLSEEPIRPRAVYCRWLEEIRADGMTTLVRAYPILADYLAATLGVWQLATRDLLTRNDRDDADVRAAFGLPADARLTGVQQGLADPHPGGRTVAVLSYCAPDDDAPHRVVYKTKDVRIDKAFHDLLAEVPPPVPNDGPLRAATVLARDGYGYMEWIPHVACDTDDELAAFYRNAGRLTAVLYLLACNDCHHANLIACRDQLVMIDGETLLEGVPDGPPGDRTAAPSRLEGRINTSVLSLGMLPQWHIAGAERAVRDMSALGIDAPEAARRNVTGWVGLNTDGMISGEVERDASPASSLPVPVGSRNRFGDFVEEFCDGFGGQLGVLLGEKDRWLRDDGPLRPLQGLTRRFVRRPTWVYLWVRGRLLQPVALASPDARQAVLDESFPDTGDDPRAEKLTAAERRQLAELHVPYFEQITDQHDVRPPAGPTIADFYRISGHHNVIARFTELEPSSIALQLRLIRGVAAAKQTRSHDTHPCPWVPTSAAPPEPLTVARSMARKLLASAIDDADGAVEWLGIHVTKNIDLTNYGAVGPGLYSGRAGIALFLNRFADVCGDAEADRYRDTALAAVRDLTTPPQDVHRWWRDQPLGLAGSGGILLALQHIPKLPADLLDGYLTGLDPDLLGTDGRLDVMFGAAGLIGPLLSIATPTAQSLARLAGDRLVEAQQPNGGWHVDAPAYRPLTGFSHGAAGMAAALAALHSATGDDRYRSAAARAVGYERERFDPVAGNWPDYRGAETPRPRFMRSWCHGAPGIALSRLCLMDSALWDEDMRTELTRALETTSAPEPQADSLCCGRLGRAAILRVAARRLNEPRWGHAAVDLERRTLRGRVQAEHYSVTEIPGLFQGAAGIGLALIDGDALTVLPRVLSGGLVDYADIRPRSPATVRTAW